MIWALALLAAPATAADARLQQIAARVSENRARLPNYTCGQTVERWHRGVTCMNCESVDRLRLDVSVISGQERFAWPGGSPFEDRSLDEMAPNPGMTFVGDFSLILEGVFLSGDAEFTAGPEKEVLGRRTFEYSYRVLGRRAGIQVRTQGGQMALPYRGTFWVDAGTLDLVRLELEILDAPADLDLASGKASIDYRRVAIGAAGILLPQQVETEVTLKNGGRFRNQTEYAGCRQYAATSSIRYEDSETPEAKAALGPRSVPAGLTILSALAEPVDFKQCAAGDELAFVVLTEVRREGFRIPKGAVLRGRITEFTARLAPAKLVVFGCRLNSIEIGGRQVSFHAQLREARRLVDRRAWIWVANPGNGETGSLLFISPSSHSRIPKGTLFTWNSVLLEKP